MSVETLALEEKLSLYLDTNVFHKFDIMPIIGKEGQALYGDKKLTDDTGKEWFVEEKAASYIHPNMVNELFQDVEKKHIGLGWFFHLPKCDFIVYGYYDAKLSDEYPAIIYRVNWIQHYDYMIELMKAGNSTSISYGTTIKNYGLTLNAYYPWNLLVDNGHVAIVEDNRSGRI